MGWLRLVGSLKLYVSFAKEPYTREYILQKRPRIWRRLLIVATPYAWPKSCVTCTNDDAVMSYIWVMSHVTHMNDDLWVMSHIWRMTHGNSMCLSDSTRFICVTQESHHVYKWWHMSHVTHINDDRWVISYILMMTHESCHTFERRLMVILCVCLTWLVLYVWLKSRVTYINDDAWVM